MGRFDQTVLTAPLRFDGDVSCYIRSLHGVGYGCSPVEVVFALGYCQ